MIRLLTGTLRTFPGLLFLAFGAIGCSKGPAGTSTDPEAAHIVKVSDLVKQFEDAHQGMPPTSLEELKSWAVKDKGAQDSDFVSSRDGDPYQLTVSGGGKPQKGSQMMVHETTGKKGLRFMSTAGSGVASEKSERMFGYIGGSGVKDVKKQQSEKRFERKKGDQ